MSAATQYPAAFLIQAESLLTAPSAANLAAASVAMEAALTAIRDCAGEVGRPGKGPEGQDPAYASLAESACRIGLLVEQAGRLAGLAAPAVSSASYSPDGEILTGPAAERQWEA